MIDFEEIKARVTIRDILASAGIEAERNRVACPIHCGSNPTSFSFTESTFICFSCGAEGGLIALVEYLQRCSRQEALRELCRLASVPFDEATNRAAGSIRKASPLYRSPLAGNSRYSELVNRLSWIELRRSALLVVLRLSRRSMREHKTPLVDYYTKDQCCLQELQELDEEVSLLNYEKNKIKRGVFDNGNRSTGSN